MTVLLVNQALSEVDRQELGGVGGRKHLLPHLVEALPVEKLTGLKSVLWIRIRLDPECFPGSGSGIICFGSRYSKTKNKINLFALIVQKFQWIDPLKWYKFWLIIKYLKKMFQFCFEIIGVGSGFWTQKSRCRLRNRSFRSSQHWLKQSQNYFSKVWKPCMYFKLRSHSSSHSFLPN